MYSGILQLGPNETNLFIEISGGEMSGTIKSADGNAATHARISLIPKMVADDEKHWLSRWGMSDKNGKYTIDGIRAGDYEVQVQHAEGALMGAQIAISGVPVVKDYTLAGGHKVSGSVRINGKPAEQTAIVAASAENDQIVGWATTDGEGTYEMQPPLPAGAYHLFVLRNDYSLEGRTVKVEGDTKQDFTPVPAGSIEVVLSSAAGQSAQGRTVSVLRDGKRVPRLNAEEVAGMLGPWMPVFRQSTDESGVARITGLRPGTYDLVIDGSDRRTQVVVKELETTKATIEF